MAVCRADSCRSVLKILNSASSCPNAVPVQGCRAGRRHQDRRRRSAAVSVLRRSARLSVKSLFTRTAPPWNAMTAISTDASIVPMNFCAAANARIWSPAPIAVMSKYRHDEPPVAIPDVARSGCGNLRLNGELGALGALGAIGATGAPGAARCEALKFDECDRPAARRLL